jgi:hypothetical protein
MNSPNSRWVIRRETTFRRKKSTRMEVYTITNSETTLWLYGKTLVLFHWFRG